MMRNRWSVDPFAAEVLDGYRGPMVADELKDAGPCVYGRGTQDMKSVCCQYLEALRRLRTAGFAPLRTIHLTFVPDGDEPFPHHHTQQSTGLFECSRVRTRRAET